MTRSLTLFATAVLASVAHLAAASPIDPAPVSVKIGFTTTLVDGKSGAATGYTTSDPNFRVGDTMTVGIHSGSVELGGDVGITGAIEPGNSEALHFWNISVRPLSAAGDTVTLAVDWKRFDRMAEGYASGGNGRRTITLNEGEHHVIDFVSAPDARPGTCVNMLVQIEAAVRDDPRLANTTLGYDLWLVDQEPSGRQMTRHLEMAGKQRESVDFNFVPIGWSADGQPVAEGGHTDVLVIVGGTVKGRLQPDGTLQIGVTPTRIVRAGEQTGMTTYRQQWLTAKPGETIRMDIPPSGPGASRTHKTSLSLTVSPW